MSSLDLAAWRDLFDENAPDKNRAKRVSDQLRDWATEEGGRVPARSDFEQFIRSHISGLPDGDKLVFAFTSLWKRVLDAHCDTVRENAMFHQRDRTRAWYARFKTPAFLLFLYAFQKLLMRISPTSGPILSVPFDELAQRLLSPANPKYPLQCTCFDSYAKEWSRNDGIVDPKSIAAWRSGAERPSFFSLGRYFKGRENPIELALNFGFSALLETVVEAAKNFFSEEELPYMRDLLIRQARCMRRLDDCLAQDSESKKHFSLEDYERYLAECIGEFNQELSWAVEQGEAALLDLRWAEFAAYSEYGQRFLEIDPTPLDFRLFMPKFDALWNASSLGHAPCPMAKEREALEKLRQQHPVACQVMEGPLLAIDARLNLLAADRVSRESMQRVRDLYRKALAASRYCAGRFTRRILCEALGFGAMLHRHNVAEGSIKPWLKQLLAWWDLIGFGNDFDHEQDAQRIERAEAKFTDSMTPELHKRLRDELPALGLVHWNLGGPVVIGEIDLAEKAATPVDKRQKQPMKGMVVGREQTPLMEAIDRGQLDQARDFVRAGADLNFINSTGDTCLTKAFARKDYDLVLEMLRRDEKPIRRATILRVTEKNQLSALEQAITHGRVEILRETARWKQGRGEVIDMDVKQIRGDTPLYYAVNRLGTTRMDSPIYFERLAKMSPSADDAEVIRPYLTLDREELDAMKEVFMREENPPGLLECIDCLVRELDVNLDVPNTNDHSALTLAAEFRMCDVAAMLLAGGANVNHRVRGGDTALSVALQKEDVDMVKLLLEYRADHRLFVERLGRPIYMMPMSECMRALIPSRL